MSASGAAEDKYVQVGDIKFAYRVFGKEHGVPLVCVPGIRPLRGVIPSTLAEHGEQVMRVLRALSLKEVDVLGFSMGGFIAQLMVLNHQDNDEGMPVIRRLVLCGSEPSTCEGWVKPKHASTPGIFIAVTEEEQHLAFLDCMFVRGSETSIRAGERAWERLGAARKVRGMLPFSNAAVGQIQLSAVEGFYNPKKETEGSWTRFEQLRLPVFIASGSDDVMCATSNSLIMWNKLKSANAQLHMYPDSGHGFFYQYPEEVAATVNAFLGTGAAGRITG